MDAKSMNIAATWESGLGFEGVGTRRTPFWHQWRTTSNSVGVLPGELATVEALQHKRDRDALIKLVSQLSAYGLSWAIGEGVPISPSTELTAQQFLNALPSSKALPKIAPDGEEGLMMVWERGGDPLLVTVEDLRLHAVIGATTQHAEYWPNIQFDRPEIPQTLLDAIPAR